MTAGAWVWTVIAAAWAGWLVVTTRIGPRTVPRFAAVIRWPLQWWAGRIVMLVIWAEVGWHLFTQRP